MPYIDKTYYDDTYKGAPIDESAFPRLLERASDVVDQITNYTIRNYEFTNLATFIQDQVKKATAAQVEYMSQNGEEVNHGGSNMTSVNIGNFGYKESKGENESLSREQKRASPAVIEYLEPTGLLYSGIDSR